MKSILNSVCFATVLLVVLYVKANADNRYPSNVHANWSTTKKIQALNQIVLVIHKILIEVFSLNHILKHLVKGQTP